jgi:hypothetical protein
VPSDHRFWLDDDQHVAPSRPKAAEKNPKYSILDPQPRMRIFSLEYAQLLTQGKDFNTEVLAGTE